MARRILQIVLVTSCLGLVAFAIYTLQKGTGNREDLMVLIPDDVHTVLHVHPMKEDNDGNILLPMIAHPDNQQMLQIIRDIALASGNHETWKACADISHTLLLFNDQNCRNPIIIIPLKRETTAAELLSALGKNCMKREFEQVTIAHCSNQFAAVVAGHLILSTASSIVEKLIMDFNLHKTISGNDLSRMQEFIEGDRDILIKVNATEWWSAELGASDSGLRTLFGEILSDTISQYFLPKAPTPLGSHTFQLPHDILSAEFLLTGDYEKTWSDLNTYFASEQPDLTSSWKNAWQEVVDTSHAVYDWRRHFQGTLGLRHHDGGTSKISCIGGEDSLIITERLTPLIAKSLTEYPGVSKMINPSILERNFINGAEGNYIAEKNHVLYFGASPTDLFAVIKDSTQLESGITQSWEEACDQAFAWYYWSQGNVPVRWKDFERYSFAMNRVSAHLRLEDDKPYLKVFLHDQVIAEKTEAAMPTESSACHDVTNHTDGSTEKLCFQEGIVERFDRQSVSLFKVNLEGELVGRVSDVDGLRNNKLQSAFVTQKKLYVIDRKGGALPGFPITSASTITSGLLVADYNNDKKYRLIFGASDGHVMNYDIAGNVVPGWQFAAVQPCVTAIHHVRCEGEDHLITVQQDGQIQVLKRNGESRNLRCNIAPSYDGRECKVLVPDGLLISATLQYTSTDGQLQNVKILLDN